MYTVNISGKKGGSGKSTISHAICTGLGLLGFPKDQIFYVLTDDRLALDDESRNYKIVDARSKEAIDELLNTVAQINDTEAAERAVMVFDGGGNRASLDARLYEACLLTLITMTPDPDSERTAALDLMKFDNAICLPNRWPTNSFASTADQYLLDEMSEEFGMRVLLPAPEVHSLNSLLLPKLDKPLLPSAKSFCKTLATQVLEIMDYPKPYRFDLVTEEEVA